MLLCTCSRNIFYPHRMYISRIGGLSIINCISSFNFYHFFDYQIQTAYLARRISCAHVQKSKCRKFPYLFLQTTQRSGSDLLPPYRRLVQVSDSLNREERQAVRKEWYPNIDKDGLLRPDRILSWFNNGRAKPNLLHCPLSFILNHFQP